MRIIPLLLLLALTACYKMDIRQGNLLTDEQRQQLKLGMNRTQVQMVLGTPLIDDPFHTNRWDYVYRFEHARALVQQQRLTLYFDGDKLIRIDDSAMPPLKPAEPVGSNP
jgi:outer membrane protein assembly factor BamE